MIKTLAFGLAGLLVPAGLFADTQTYAIDPAHSAATFSIRHMMISNVEGKFGQITGKIAYDPNDLKNSTVTAAINVSTVNTNDEKRDGDLKSPNFFDVEKYPQMTFQSTAFTKSGDTIQVKGNLTMHGITKPVVLDIDGPTPEVKDPWGKSRRGVTATTKLDRKDFGLLWNKNLDGGGVLVGDQVKVTINLEAVR